MLCIAHLHSSTNKSFVYVWKERDFIEKYAGKEMIGNVLQQPLYAFSYNCYVLQRPLLRCKARPPLWSSGGSFRMSFPWDGEVKPSSVASRHLRVKVLHNVKKTHYYHYYVTTINNVQGCCCPLGWPSSQLPCQSTGNRVRYYDGLHNSPAVISQILFLPTSLHQRSKEEGWQQVFFLIWTHLSTAKVVFVISYVVIPTHDK